MPPLFIDRLTALSASCFFVISSQAFAQAPPQQLDTSNFGPSGAECAELRFTDFAIVEDAMTQITDARPIEGTNGLSSYCQVEGYVWPSSRFRLRYPLDDWNEKIVVNGTGGQAGGLPNDDPATGRFGQDLRAGFATVQHDGGHFSTITDAKWAYYNPKEMLDGGFRTPYVVTLASKAILERVTGHRPNRSYYNGCSNGGREAMMMAQRFPHEFDGIIAGAPSIAPTDLFLNMYFASELLRDQSPEGFNLKAAQTLHHEVLKQCDALDGIQDGVIDDPRECKVDFSLVTCREGSTDSCLTDHQANIAKQIYDGPRTPEGRQIAPSSAYPGSELSWIAFITPRWTIDYAKDVFRFLAFYPPAGPEFEPNVGDLDEYGDRMGVFESLTGATDPDLRKFKANGGKLISYYGWADAFGGANAILDYYETAERVMGGKDNTQDFFRLFMVPGMDHCGGGAGASVFDFVSALDTWVEDGTAPDAMTGYRPGPDGKPLFTRSIQPYTSN